jgi:hypothetical protein
MAEKPGPTGRFPDGKISWDDEGELKIGVAYDPAINQVRFEFGKPVAWLAMPSMDAVNLAMLILKAAWRAR